jgi:hypothetical protein
MQKRSQIIEIHLYDMSRIGISIERKSSLVFSTPSGGGLRKG